MANRKGKIVYFRTDEQTFELLQKIADEQGRTMSNLVGMFVKNSIDSLTEQNETEEE